MQDLPGQHCLEWVPAEGAHVDNVPFKKKKKKLELHVEWLPWQSQKNIFNDCGVQLYMKYVRF